jgi:hypothetical protein
VSSTRAGPRPESVLAAGGAIALLSIAGQLVTLYSDSDLRTPIGRFRAMSEALGHVAPLLGASALLLAGSWNTDEKGRRAAVGACLALFVVLSLLAIPTVLPDSRQLSSGVIPAELFKFQSQVIRELLYLIGTPLLLGIALWKFLRRTPL